MAEPDGRDTALARLLLARGVLDVATLRTCLDEVRRRRVAEPGLELSAVLLGRGAVARDALVEADSLLGAAEGLPSLAGAPEVRGYRVVRELARGGMGRLYEVEQLGTGVRRALKTVLVGGLAPEEALRFQREAELLARLDHPAIVRVHEASLAGQTPFIVMDLLPGGSLQDRIDRGPLLVDDALRIAATLARGLEHAHARGVLHRDLKPRNVVFDGPEPHGRPRLVDLGLARSLDARSLTMSGTILGTPAYMAPEQVTGRRADERTDVFGLGAVLYAMLTGRAPYGGAGGALAVLSAALRGAAEPVRSLRPDVPASAASLCARAMALDPGDRFPSATDLALALEAELRAPARASSRAPVLALLGLASIALVALAVTRQVEPVAPIGPVVVTAPPGAPARSAAAAPPSFAARMAEAAGRPFAPEPLARIMRVRVRPARKDGAQ